MRTTFSPMFFIKTRSYQRIGVHLARPAHFERPGDFRRTLTGSLNRSIP
jgi:hypothetical protein